MYPSIDFQIALRFFASGMLVPEERTVSNEVRFVPPFSVNTAVDWMKWMIVQTEDGLQRSLRGVLLWVKEAEAVVQLAGWMGGVVDSDASLCFNDSFLDDRGGGFLIDSLWKWLANVLVEILEGASLRAEFKN